MNGVIQNILKKEFSSPKMRIKEMDESIKLEGI